VEVLEFDTRICGSEVPALAERGSPAPQPDSCFVLGKNEAVPTAFYNFAAARPGFLARNLPSSLGRRGTAISVAPRRRSVSFPWQSGLAGAMSRPKAACASFPV